MKSVFLRRTKVILSPSTSQYISTWWILELGCLGTSPLLTHQLPPCPHPLQLAHAQVIITASFWDVFFLYYTLITFLYSLVGRSKAAQAV